MKVVLASTSKYRKELFARLQVPFSVVSPEVAEHALQGEAPQETAKRLAEAKARAVAGRHPDAIVIGCDQVAVADGRILGKPGNRENAVHQLRALSGRQATFYTALCVHNTTTGRTGVRVVPCRVTFRTLADPAIERYLDREQPYECAGSAKSEGLGIALIARLQGDDPSALIGLPLIALVDLLAEQGVQIP
jgi:septum formation protein